MGRACQMNRVIAPQRHKLEHVLSRDEGTVRLKAQFSVKAEHSEIASAPCVEGVADIVGKTVHGTAKACQER